MPTDTACFQEEAYWKGPTRVNTNWLLVEALAAHHDDGTATALVESTLQLVDGSGFSEYFSPLTGRGYGAASSRGRPP